MRLAAAIGLTAVSIAAAVYVHQQHSAQAAQSCTSDYFGASQCVSYSTGHPSWRDPVAALLVTGGLAVAVSIINHRLPAKPS